MINTFNNRFLWRGARVVHPGLEAIVGKDNFQNPWFLRKGLERSRCVGLVSNLGTGWLIGNSLLMTNWHVLRRLEWAKGKNVFFNFEQNEDGSVAQTVPVPLDPETFFVSVEDLDYAVVAVKGDPGKELGYIDVSSPGHLDADVRVNIIQHPNAGMKKIAIRDNGLKYFDDRILQYWTDTEHGSSGSPVFDDQWNIIGLHFRHDFASDPDNPDEPKIIYNEGHTITSIVSDLNGKFPGILN